MSKTILFWKANKNIYRIVLFIFLNNLGNVIAQSSGIKGKIEDAATGESLIGATVVMQGTNKGITTDYNGLFALNELQPGSYNLVISYVTYEQQILRAEVKRGETLELDVKLKPVSVELDEVKVTATRRTDTELSLISSIRASDVVSSGISKQQISRSQDRDASEVISRVPGVTVRDGKFINVRGLDERYNTVWLNGTGAPSSEADRRAFSFDMLPSSLIDNLVLYKTPAPELPADFAGAAVQILTKSTVDANSINISYSAGYRQNTTFRDFYTYDGGKTDWLGFDDGNRSLPEGFPSTSEFRELADNPSEEDRQKITELGRAFNKTWSPELTQASPDQSFMATINRKFLVGKASLGNVTSIGYSAANQLREVFRAGYQAYDKINDQPDTSYYFYDDLYATKTKLNGLFNWLLVFGNIQKIEFRNFFNQISDKTTILRSGRDFYGGSYKTATELGFQSRTIYSGQLTGSFNFNNYNINLSWLLGYGYTNKLQPDTRRVEMSRNEDAGASAPYTTSLNFNADPKLLGRLTLNNHENIWVGGLNYSNKIIFTGFTPEIKAGIFVELKDRAFSARNIGYAISNVMNFNWDLVYQPIDSLFQDKNINYTNGIKVDESTNLSDSYDASNKLYAAYAGLNLPFNKLKIYSGVRMEKNIQQLNGFDENGDSVAVDNNQLDFFPSVNITYKITKRIAVRAAYGRSINRPEFREIAPYTYYNFEEKATYYGNPELVNSYVHNAELRFEYFPEEGDMITAGGFYKQFSNPIEAHMIESGTGLNYFYDNAISAESYGLEVDLRKSFKVLAGSESFLRIFQDFVIVFNAAIIKSKLKTDFANARDSVRQMQGQSPFIVNTGVFYDNARRGLMISVLYNVIGPRIAYVGNPTNPHIYQMPRNLLDITISKKIGKYFTVKAGVKDIFNQPIELKQDEYVQIIPNNSDTEVKRVQQTLLYKPSTAFTLGISLNF
ncbi:MAG: TonB-dependent receptor [Bacteroidales bacterium]|nr:TonB-dependent receptor [Bacteroidales bacterium]